MANEVFANNLEIACKAADGKSVACFPDVCFTPPSPPAGWIPIPYANTAYAKDTANASKTVFISGKPVMKKDVSYFKTSTGNEPAAGPQGIMTHVKKGKAYFTSWSMNVKIEGQNVDRHTDLTTHNHGSTSNTAPWFYADSSVVGGKCKTTREIAEKKCKTDHGKKKGAKKGGKGAAQTNEKAEDWKKRHCGNIEEINKKRRTEHNKLKEKRKEFAKLAEKVKKAMAAVDGMEAKLKKMAMEKTAKVVGKAALKGWLGPIGWAWTAYDVVSTGVELYEEADKIKKVLDSLKETKEQMDKVLKEGADIEKGIKEITDAIVAAAGNECIQARKCILFPHRNKSAACCPGQTPHHIVPNAMFQEAGGRGNSEKNIADCPGYDTGDAPCVCVEGHNQHMGTHRIIHENTDNELKDVVNITGGKVSLKDAKTSVVEAHQKSFKNPTCSKKCLEAQLNAYYSKACKKTANLRPVDSVGKTVTSEPTSDEEI